VDFAVQLDPTPKNLLGQNTLVHDGLMILHKCVKGGAWPHEVRGMTCLLNCDNGQDPHCMVRVSVFQTEGLLQPGFAWVKADSAGTAKRLTYRMRISDKGLSTGGPM
jgi:hypothetical protein